MSEGDPAELPKHSDKEQLQVAKEDTLDGIQVALAERCLPRGSLPASIFGDASALTSSNGGSKPSSSSKPQHGSTLPRLRRRLLKSGQDTDQDQTGVLLVPATQPTPPPLARPSAMVLMIRQCLQLAEQLKEDYRQTDQLLDQVLQQATEINLELIHQNDMVRKRRLLRELETMYTGSMHVMVEVIRAEFDSI